MAEQSLTSLHASGKLASTLLSITYAPLSVPSVLNPQMRSKLTSLGTTIVAASDTFKVNVSVFELPSETVILNVP